MSVHVFRSANVRHFPESNKVSGGDRLCVCNIEELRVEVDGHAYVLYSIRRDVVSCVLAFKKLQSPEAQCSNR